MAAKTIGAAIVWLPPLLLIVAVPFVFAKVSAAPLDALIVKLAPPELLKPRLATLWLLSKVTVPPLVPTVPKTAESCWWLPGTWLLTQLPAAVHEPLPVCQTPATTLGAPVIDRLRTLLEVLKVKVSLATELGFEPTSKALMPAVPRITLL